MGLFGKSKKDKEFEKTIASMIADNAKESKPNASETQVHAEPVGTKSELTHIAYNDGSVYDGEASDGKKNGFGKTSFPNGDTATGFHKNGAYHGVLLYTFADGKKRLALYNMGTEVEKIPAEKTFTVGFEKYCDIDVTTFKLKTVFMDSIRAGMAPQTENKPATAEPTIFDKVLAQKSAASAPAKPEIKRVVMSNGDVYEGERKDGKKHGHGKYTSAKGWVYEGDFSNDTMTGYGRITFNAGGFYEGNFVNCKRNGTGKGKSASGNYYVGEYKDDKMDGKGKMTYADGTYYDGEWKESKKHGHGIFTEKDEDTIYVYEGEWIDGERHGGHRKHYADAPQFGSVDFFDHGKFLASISVTEQNKNWTMEQFEADMRRFKDELKRDQEELSRENAAEAAASSSNQSESESEDEWETFDTIAELYEKYSNPEDFDDPRDKNILNGCKYMEQFYVQIKDAFDETNYNEANTIVCEMLCIEKSHFVDFISGKFRFWQHIDFKEWLLTVMDYAADVFANAEDTSDSDTPIALLNLGYHLYQRTMPFDSDWLMPYISCRYCSGEYDGGLAMGTLFIARHYLYSTEACEIDSEDTDCALSFWEENYGEKLKAVLEKGGALYCDGYLYTTVDDDDEDDDDDDDEYDPDAIRTFTTDSGNTFTGYTDEDGVCTGWGRMEYEDGDSREGFWSDGQMNDFGIEHSGNNIYIGMFSDGLRNGLGVLKEPNSGRCCPVTGTYFDDGNEVLTNPDFNYGSFVCTLGELGDNRRYYGRKDGYALQGWGRTWTYDRNPIAYKEGMFESGSLKFGIWAMFYDDGSIFIEYGHYDKDGRLCTVRSDEEAQSITIRNGKFSYYDCGQFHKGMMHGKGKRTYSSGLTIWGQFDNDKLIAITSVVKPNGQRGDPANYNVNK